MLFSKLKWTALGIVLTLIIVFLYNNRSSLKSLTGSNTNSNIGRVNPAFASYISAFTSGYISSGSTIRVKFATELAGNTQLNTPLAEDYFSFEPSIKGKTIWKDAQTIEFQPEERLQAGQNYKAVFHLDKLLEVKNELEEFEFPFTVIKQSVVMDVNDLKSYHSGDYDYYSLSGNVGTADFVEQGQVEKMLEAKLSGSSLKIKWVHNEDGTLHQFLMDSIERPSLIDSKLVINCDAGNMDLPYKQSRELLVPSGKSFVVLNAKVADDNEQYVQVSLSNPVSLYQSLEGLINISDCKDVKYIVAGNQVLIYPNNISSGSHKLKISGTMKDTRDNLLGEESEYNLVFNETKPSVRFSGKGNILPSSNGMSMSFETVNLMAVDVKITRIYENNILQFLQENDLDGGSQLARVGKRVVNKRINLGITNPSDYGNWKRFSLDISNLIKAEPGAIYNVSLGFRKAYSTYPCLRNGKDKKFEMEELTEPIDEEEENYFGYYYENNYGGYDDYEEGDEYRWEDRDNPCKSAYYSNYGVISRNILASDIALTVKKGSDGSMMIAANDIISTKPISNINVELYDYQKQLIQTLVTNSDGQIFTTPARRPYFVVARKDKQSAYVRLDDAATLSLAMYDVSGEAIKKGIKGFIYGERGVWRPGDSVYLNFILEDKLGAIPAGLPVSISLFNPQGQLAKRQLSAKSVDGFYNFTMATDKNAPTGFWNAEVKVGAIRFNKSIRIETVMPNRLKIKVNVGDNKLLAADKNNLMTLATAWLTGAKARRLAAKVGVSLSSGTTEFEKFKDYNFSDKTLRFEAQNIKIFDGKVNDEGRAEFPVNLEVRKNAPGFLKAGFTTQVFEPGGAFSIDHFSMDYSPYNCYLGVKLPDGEKRSGILYTAKDHYIKIVSVDARGVPISRSNLKFELYKLEWRWWWDQYRDEVANFTSDEYHKPVKTEYFSTSGGKAEIKVNIDENQWGRYLVRIIDMNGGHSTSAVTYFDWANWMERDGDSQTKILSNMLSFNTDKESYKNGEEAGVTIPSPENGRALVTIENGSRVLEAHWLETEKGSTLFKFKITPAMAPNVYVHVSLLQPHARTNDLAIRLYGVAAIQVDDPGTHLEPVLKLPSVLVPEQMVEIAVSENSGKEMAFTLAMVDEGLLDLTRFKTPDPHKTFYAREALGVKTWDVYDNVIGAYGGELERVLSIGGDGSELNRDGAKANRFKPMVKCLGPFHLGKGEKKLIRFKMPMYVGSVRTMLIAGYKGAYGTAEVSTPVKAPLMVLATLPRGLSVNEEVKLPISVFGGEKNVGPTSVKLEVNGLLQVVGGNVKTINVGKDDEKLVGFDVKVKGQPGIAKAKITASGGGYSTVYEMELDIRNPNPYQTISKDFTIDEGKTLEETIQPIGLPGTNSGVLELSTVPSINLESRLRYLIAYPHGCVEQTTSKTFAQLYLSDLLELSGDKITEIESNIKSGIYELGRFQLPSGALSYWRGSNELSDWGTSYAGHFMLMAEKKGYSLPAGFKKSWINYQQTCAQNFDVNKPDHTAYQELQAYRLFVLALANNPVLGAMNRLTESGKLTNLTRWWLAAAYAQSGQIGEAEKLLAKASTQVEDYKINYYTYGSSQRDMAVILQTLCMLNKKQQAYAQLKKVAAFLSSQTWCSTQTTAFGLVAAAAFVKKFGGASALQATCKINGKEVNSKVNGAFMQVPVDFTGTSTNIKVENQGKGVVFVKLSNKGKPSAGEEKEAAENIAMEVVYKDLSGAPFNPEECEQGVNFMMTVTVKNLGLVGEIKNLALSSYIPSGWEIRNTRLEENEAALKNSAYSYQDIRDDRVLTYFDLAGHESKTFSILLNASYEGHYYLPAINAEAMYDNTVYARTQGRWIKVVQPQNKPVPGR